MTWFKRRPQRNPPQGIASSFHLFWQGVPDDVVGAAATVEVLEPPTVDELYFWALQVSFRSGSSQTGGAHIGLQHHPSYPGAGAVNWGGYDDVVGGIIEGTVSELPSALGNANTRTYPWQPRRRYRYEVSRGDSGWWQGDITDLETGDMTRVRELNGHDADRLGGLMVWSEVFAPCQAPGVVVRWSDLSYQTRSGLAGAPHGLFVNYQAPASHGCSNTNSYLDAAGVVQATATQRSSSQGEVLRWGSRDITH
jgi:hypothetical protein